MPNVIVIAGPNGAGKRDGKVVILKPSEIDV
ncbi:MAG: ATP-binding protein [Pyrinomonadaceae bacterium]|nr:ATP-binding protein [Pyrinomonadaceae bacterium]